MTSYFHLLGHLAVAEAGLNQSAELTQLLTKAGANKAEFAGIHALVEEGEKLITRFALADENRIADHNVHVAGAEVEMWAQTVQHLLRKKFDAELLQTAMGKKIHTHNHTVTIVAQTLRLLAMLRTDSRIQSALGDERKVRDIGTRGWSLLHRLLTSVGVRFTPSIASSEPISAEMDAFAKRVKKFIDSLEAPSRQVGQGNLPLLGLLGLVPDGLGIPVGGTAFNVVLHERGQGSAPNLADKRPTSGWSIGRQGRNRENLGNGRVEPTFE